MTSQITVLAPAFYPAPAEWETRYLRRSADRYDIPVRFYGAGESYRGWLDVQIGRLLAELQTIDTPLVLYTDGSDSLFLSGLDEIEAKYERLGSPDLLFSAEPDGINAGGWMGSRLSAIACLRILQVMEGSTNPQDLWRELIAQSPIIRTQVVQVDTDCRIFQTTSSAHLKIVSGPQLRIMNTDTGSLPSVLHFCGGYTSPEDGKALLIEPLWRQLGYAQFTSHDRTARDGSNIG